MSARPWHPPLPVIKEAADKVGSFAMLAEKVGCHRQHLYNVKSISPKLARGLQKATGWPLWRIAPDIWPKPGRK